MMKKLLISFSGGRTSAFMTWWLLNQWKERHEWEMMVVFANTGKEREETLEFVDKCDKNFKFSVNWIEAVVNPDFGKGTSFKVVDYETANRTGEPFRQVIAKYGIPNKPFPHCSRELKAVPIKAFARAIGWYDYHTAIGIRNDEIDRISEKRQENKLLYPLVSLMPTTKGNINAFWGRQSFDLRLKSYEGNCDLCWKKTKRKLLTIAKEDPSRLNWWAEMERTYEYYTPPTRISDNPPYRFFRNNATVHDINEMALLPFKPARDESKDIIYRQRTIEEMMNQGIDEDMDSSFGCVESCEPF